MTYYTHEQRQKGLETRKYKSNLKKTRESPEDYYDIWDIKVPRVSKKPRREDYGVSEDTAELLEKLDFKYKEKEKNKRLAIFIIFVSLLTFGALIYMTSGGEIENVIAILITILIFGIIPVSVYLDIEYIEPPKTNIHEKFEEFNRNMKYYLYWQRRREKRVWNSMTGYVFEKEVANLFREINFDAEVTKGSGDNGVDIVLKQGDRKIAVQCKRYSKKVGPHIIRDLLGTMHHLGYVEGAIVTTTGFSKSVQDFASKNKSIYLIDLNDILKSVEEPEYLLNKIKIS